MTIQLKFNEPNKKCKNMNKIVLNEKFHPYIMRMRQLKVCGKKVQRITPDNQ